MAHIDYYMIAISPFCYLAGDRLEQIASRNGATITYKPVDGAQLFGRTGGQALKDRHPNRQAYRLQMLQRGAKKTGLDLNFQPAFFPTNMAPASYAIIAAQKAGGGDTGQLCQLLLSACWAENRNIAEDDVIRDCLGKAGFDPGLADSGLLMGAEIYAANLEEAVDRGVFGAPFYITDDDQRFWGQDSLDDLDLHLQGKL